MKPDHGLTRTELRRIAEEFQSERDAAKRDVMRAFDERNVALDRATAAETSLARVTAEREALAAAMPSEGADAALAYAAERTARMEAERQLSEARAERDEARNTDWYTQCRQAREMVAGLHREARDWRGRAEAAECRLSEARADAERLDWLIAGAAYRFDDRTEDKQAVALCLGSGVAFPEGVRAAIDSAKSQNTTGSADALDGGGQP